ncbi:MAG: hypothetical protein KDB79_11200 [Acidobacteria bacterium]|nr:hypothetical protein [Acidobacteriota bacterium]
MFISLWLLIPVSLVLIGLLTWAFLAVKGRNPLPFPDNGSRIFAATSVEAKDAIVELFAVYGLIERFRMDTDEVKRSIMWDGTIINHSSPELCEKLEGASSCIGIVSGDPLTDAEKAVEFLKSRGFSAKVVPDVEPELPIVFVVTDAMNGTALNFRRHVIHLPRPK